MTIVDTYIFYIHYISKFTVCGVLFYEFVELIKQNVPFYNICQEDPVYQVFQHPQYFIMFMQQVHTLRCPCTWIMRTLHVCCQEHATHSTLIIEVQITSWRFSLCRFCWIVVQVIVKRRWGACSNRCLRDSPRPVPGWSASQPEKVCWFFSAPFVQQLPCKNSVVHWTSSTYVLSQATKKVELQVT